jgi:predicted RNA-binding Zn-ribbon protein involved in translation (DUF1610 family)
MRTSTVDGSMLFDFYYGIQQADYVATFTRAISEIHVKTMGIWGDIEQRGKAYAFAKCPNCGAVVLTRRDSNELYTCQGCDKKVPVSPFRTPESEELLSSALAAVGLSPKPVDAGVIFLAVAPKDETQAEIVGIRLISEGYTSVGPGRVLYEHFLMGAHERGTTPPGALRIWMKEIATSQMTAREDDMPEELDRLIRSLRRESGALWSMSMTAPESDACGFLMKTHDEVFDEMKMHAARSPNNVRLVRTAIETAVRLGRLSEGNELLTPLRLTSPDDPDCWAATAAIALGEKRYASAIDLLERVLAVRPRDQMARGELIRACEAAGNMRRAAELTQELRVHGFLPERPESLAQS